MSIIGSAEDICCAVLLYSREWENGCSGHADLFVIVGVIVRVRRGAKVRRWKAVRWVAPKGTSSVQIRRDALDLDWVEDTNAKVFLLLGNGHPLSQRANSLCIGVARISASSSPLCGGMCTRASVGSHPYSSSPHLVKMAINPQV